MSDLSLSISATLPIYNFSGAGAGTPSVARNTPASSPNVPATSVVGVLTGLSGTGRVATDALGIERVTQVGNQSTALYGRGVLLANVLSPGINQPASLYSVVSQLAAPRAASTVDFTA